MTRNFLLSTQYDRSQETQIIAPITHARSTEEDTDRFRNEVLDGLSKPQRSLPSKYFYDSVGDVLYNKIMATDEYYLARCEMEIFEKKTSQLLSVIANRFGKFVLVELGPGDMRKSIHLISALHMMRAKFEYVPIDISKGVIDFISTSLPGSFPNLPIHPMNGEYLEMLQLHNKDFGHLPKVILCLGGNIANMSSADTEKFCRKLSANMKQGDIAVIGFDLKKNPEVIRAAYNDKTGVTAAFNLNLLTRINSELGGNFCIEKFGHYCHYDPESGSCKSYLVCLQQMEVTIGNKPFHLEKDECIWMEISQKYSREDIGHLATATGFSIIGNICDQKKWFTDSVWVAR